MSFNEIYRKYKNNTASDKEKLQVMEELEKYKTLTDDYLDEQSVDFNTKSQNDSKTQWDINEDEVKTIKSREKTKNVRLVLISVIIVCLLFLTYKFAAVPFLNKYVLFGPETYTISKSEYFSDLQIELETFTSLHAPFVKIAGIGWESTGLGKYDLTLQLVNRDDTSNHKYENGYIKNGKVKLNPYSETTMFRAGYFDLRKNDYSQKEIDEHNKAELKKLSDLESDFTAARTTITLKDRMDMGVLAKYINKYDDLTFEWAAIVPSELGNIAPLLGMDLEGSNMMISPEDKAKYGDFPGFTEIEYTKEGLENHFTNMLEFQKNNEDLVSRIVDMNEFSSVWYDGVTEYIDGNGVEAYGLVIKGNPLAIAEFYKEVPCIDITVRDVMLDVE